MWQTCDDVQIFKAKFKAFIDEWDANDKFIAPPDQVVVVCDLVSDYIKLMTNGVAGVGADINNLRDIGLFKKLIDRINNNMLYKNTLDKFHEMEDAYDVMYRSFVRDTSFCSL